MLIAYLSKTSDPWINSFRAEFEECIEIDSIEEILNAKVKYDGIALIGFPDDEMTEIIRKIKSSDKLFLIPVIADSSALESGLAINVATNLVEARQNITNISVLSKQIEKSTFLAWESRLLAYMFTRPSVKLKVFTDWKHRNYYHYPLIEAFKSSGEEALAWLNDMVNSKVLTREDLVDQIFVCPFCSSAHIKFTDHCTNCEGINIINDKFLHCFKCGLVAPQNDFLKDVKLCCPRCHAALKHIGDDYDIALESGVCQGCGNLSIEPNLLATCMICGKYYSADKLIKQCYFNYSLSELGYNQIKYNEIDIEPILLENSSYVNNEYFYYLLDWMLQLSLKYKSDNISILGLYISFNNDEHKHDALYLLVRKLPTIIEKTDICTRIGSNYFWFILVKTDLKEAKLVEDRILNYFNEFSKGQVILKTTKYIPTEKDMVEPGKLLIARLASEL